jgi:hypothetical protein
MNSLNDTAIFKMALETFKTIKDFLKPTIIESFVIDPSYYDYYLKIFKGYKYPLAKAVVEYGEKSTVKLVNFGDPKNPEKTKIFNMPSYFPPFIFPSKDNGLISYVNIAARSHYIRNKITNEIETIKISERELYTFMQSATANLICYTKRDELKSNTKFIKLVAEIYSILLSRCIDKTYPLSADRDSYIILNFFCIIYCLQTMFGLSEESAIQYAYTIKIIDKAVVETKCKTLDSDLTMKSIEDLNKAIENEFDYIRKGSIKYRNLILMYTKMYGQNSMFAVEHFFSFFNMIEMANMRIGMYNDMAIDQLAKTYVKDLETILLSVTGL